MEDFENKIIKNINTKMAVGTYAHPILHSMIGEYMTNHGNNIIKKYSESNAIFKTAPFKIDVNNAYTGETGMMIRYIKPNKELESADTNLVKVPVSVVKTAQEYGYVANSEYKFKLHADIAPISIMQIESYLCVNEFRIPLYVESDSNISISNARNVSINGIDLRIDNTFADNFYDDSLHKAEKYLDFIEETADDKYANIKDSSVINKCTGRHLRYLVSCFIENGRKINYSSMIWDTLCLSNRNLSRHLTWNEWNDMRRCISPFYPLPIQVDFEYERVEAVKNEVLKGMNYKPVLNMVIRTFRGSSFFQKPGYNNSSIQSPIQTALSVHDMQNDDYLRAFYLTVSIPRNLPSIIITDGSGVTKKYELKLAPTKWKNGNIKLSLAENSINIYPKTDGVSCTSMKIKETNREKGITNYMKNIDMNAFLLPSERSVMEWHEDDLM